MIKRLFSLRPTPRLLALLLLLAAFAMVNGLLRVFNPELEMIDFLSQAFWWTLAAVTLFTLIDLTSRLDDSSVPVERVLPRSMALNKPHTIRYQLTNDSQRDIKMALSDALPASCVGPKFPLEHMLHTQQVGLFEYSVVPKKRGMAVFEPAYVLISSQFQFWQFIHRLGGKQEIRVYPDFSAISDSFIFGAEQAMRNMGAHIAKQKGGGMEFHQLREFREGDTLKQIDWKATAKSNTPISREYQEEKDQNVLFLLDCSRRMRAMENNLSYFDYALNALLMTSYIALDKGDAVGMLTFSGEPSWLPPIKGKSAINTMLNHLYALTTSTESSDYVNAAEEMLLKQRKRSLVIILTNVRDEDKEDLTKAVDILMRRHLVMVVALQERLLESVDDIALTDTNSTLLYAGTKQFEHSRKKMLALLRASGVSVVDATHKNIHVKLVSEYLRLKRMGRI